MTITKMITTQELSPALLLEAGSDGVAPVSPDAIHSGHRL